MKQGGGSAEPLGIQRLTRIALQERQETRDVAAHRHPRILRGLFFRSFRAMRFCYRYPGFRKASTLRACRTLEPVSVRRALET